MCYYIKKCENVITGYSSQCLQTKPARSEETGNVCPSELHMAFPASGLHQDWKRRNGGWLRRTAKSHPPFSRNELAVNCKCNPDQKKKKKIPSLPIQRAAPFTLGHTASHPVCPQRGKGSGVGCSRPYLPCTSLLHLSGSSALCGEEISYAFIWRAEHRDWVIPPCSTALFQVKGWCSWAKTLIFMSLVSCCVSSLPSLKVFSLLLLITVPELAATTHSRTAGGKSATLHDSVQLVPIGRQAPSIPM